MKKQFELIVQFKFVWGLIFTATILLYSFISMFQGKKSMEFVLIWQFVAITMILTLIHYLIFGEFIFKSVSTKHKIVFHFGLCYLLMILSSTILNWIDITSLKGIGGFTIFYILLYLSICFSLYMYYKITGEQLNNKLAKYKEQKKSN